MSDVWQWFGVESTVLGQRAICTYSLQKTPWKKRLLVSLMQASCLYLKWECLTGKLPTLFIDKSSRSNVLFTSQTTLLTCLLAAHPGSAVAAITAGGKQVITSTNISALCLLWATSHQLNLIILWATLALWSVSFCANIQKLLCKPTFKTNKRHLLKCFQKYLWLNTILHFCVLWLPNTASYARMIWTR